MWSVIGKMEKVINRFYRAKTKLFANNHNIKTQHPRPINKSTTSLHRLLSSTSLNFHIVKLKHLFGA